MNQKSQIGVAVLILIVVGALLVGCALVGGGSSISGQVTWAGEPVEGATVELRSGDGVAMTAATDAEGQYRLARPAEGDYVLWAIWPDGTAGGSGGSVQVAAGDVLTGRDIPIYRQLDVIAPTSGEHVTQPPTLEWAGFDGASEYRVLVINAGTSELVTEQRTPDTHMTVAETLDEGQTYDWVVQAYDAAGLMLAEHTGLFTVSES